MDKIQQLTTELSNLLDKAIEKREKEYEKRSDAWKESEKGEAHFALTEAMTSVKDSLEELDFAFSEVESL